MKPVQDLLKEKGIAISNFSWRPAKLFEGGTRANISLSILVSTNNKKVYSTTYNKWSSEERPKLFKSISYLENSDFRYNFIPKLGNKLDKNIYRKVYNLPTLGSKVANGKTTHKIYYRNTGGLYWKIFTDFQPEFYKDGKKTKSSREAHLYSINENDMYTSLALFWSNFYWWWYIVNSNGRDNNPFDLKSMPITDGLYQDGNLIKLAKRLMKDLIANSEMAERKHDKSLTVGQKFSPKMSKSIVDEIDETISKYYGFLPDELTYLKHYDLKYRLGREE
ncbi:hypothetical protein ES705_24203 [subsurface metagenome]